MRTTLSALVACLLVLAACTDSDDSAFRQRTTTTQPDGDPSTTTTSGEDDGRRGDEFTGDGQECEVPPAVLISTGAPAQEPSQEVPEDECVPEPEPGPTPEPELGTGDVQVTLRWESSADLDLHVIEPDGTRIYYAAQGPTDTGGRLDVDSNVGCRQEASVENVYWPTGRMPEGSLTVEVKGFSVDGCGGGDYTLEANVQGEQVLNESGSVGEDEIDSYEIET